MAATALAQGPTNTVGVVAKLDVGAGAMTLKSDNGVEVAVQILPTCRVRRVAPGETHLKNAIAVSLAEIAPGDRVLARGIVTEGIVQASSVLLVTQTDLARKHAMDRADWEARGITGLVTQTGRGAIVIRSRTLAGSMRITIRPGEGAGIRRYEPDSVSFFDAKAATLDDIKAGDQVRARGTRSADGAALVAEEIVFGTFKTFAAIVVSIDEQAGELRVHNIGSRKPMTVKVTSDSNLRTLQPQLAQWIAVRLHPELATTIEVPKGGAASRPAAPDFHKLVENSPAITLADLKAGDAIIVSSTVGITPHRVTAITLMAGVEPILSKPGNPHISLGAWSLETAGGMQLE
jgi:hypothetical protein